MTGMMIVVVPTVIGLGTFLGSYLRSISKKAQAQAIVHYIKIMEKVFSKLNVFYRLPKRLQ